MGKNQKLHDLRRHISNKSGRIRVLLENILYKSDNKEETDTLAVIALDEINRISKMSDKIGKFLKQNEG